MKRRSFFIFSLLFVSLAFVSTSAIAGPSLEELQVSEINEMLESSRAKSKSDIKALMKFGLVIPGGSAKSGLTTVSFAAWKQPKFKFYGFSKDSSTFMIGGRKWVTWWDVASGSLKRAVLVESKKYYLFGANRDGSRLIVGEADLDGNKSEFDFAVYDGTTLKEIAELGYNKGSEEEIFGNFNNAVMMDFAMSPGGRWFILAHSTGPYQIWDVQSGKLVQENYGYSNQRQGTWINFSDDDKFASLRGGGKDVLYSLEPFKMLRELKGLDPVLSSKGTFVANPWNSLYKIGGGDMCTVNTKISGAGFTYDEKYWLVAYQDAVAFHTTQGKGCPEVNVVWLNGELKQKKYFTRVVPAPDGKHYAFVGGMASKDGSGIKEFLRIVQWQKPNEDIAQVTVKAERGLELYNGGLKKQGMAILLKLVKSNPVELFSAGYHYKFSEAGVPASLLGEMFLSMDRQESSLRPVALSYYALYACQAKHPFLAAKALGEVNKYLKATSYTFDMGTMAVYNGANALSMKVAGRDDDAYSALIEVGANRKLVNSLITLMDLQSRAFTPLLKDPGKLALALDLDKMLLPKPGKDSPPQDYVDLFGNVVKVQPPATPTVNEKQTESPGVPFIKKKSTVVFE